MYAAHIQHDQAAIDADAARTVSKIRYTEDDYYADCEREANTPEAHAEQQAAIELYEAHVEALAMNEDFDAFWDQDFGECVFEDAFLDYFDGN